MGFTQIIVWYKCCSVINSDLSPFSQRRKETRHSRESVLRHLNRAASALLGNRRHGSSQQPGANLGARQEKGCRSGCRSEGEGDHRAEKQERSREWKVSRICLSVAKTHRKHVMLYSATCGSGKLLKGDSFVLQIEAKSHHCFFCCWGFFALSDLFPCGAGHGAVHMQCLIPLSHTVAAIVSDLPYCLRWHPITGAGVNGVRCVLETRCDLITQTEPSCQALTWEIYVQKWFVDAPTPLYVLYPE